MGYIPFTEQQRERARRTDLGAFLRQCGEEVKRSGSENMWLDHGQKVTIRGNLWFHQYEQVGGRRHRLCLSVLQHGVSGGSAAYARHGCRYHPGAGRTFSPENIGDSPKT